MQNLLCSWLFLCDFLKSWTLHPNFRFRCCWAITIRFNCYINLPPEAKPWKALRQVPRFHFTGTQKAVTVFTLSLLPMASLQNVSIWSCLPNLEDLGNCLDKECNFPTWQQFGLWYHEVQKLDWRRCLARTHCPHSAKPLSTVTAGHSSSPTADQTSAAFIPKAQLCTLSTDKTSNWSIAGIHNLFNSGTPKKYYTFFLSTLDFDLSNCNWCSNFSKIVLYSLQSTVYCISLIGHIMIYCLC